MRVGRHTDAHADEGCWDVGEKGGSLGHLQDGPTASRPTFRLIQVLRALAAVLVVIYHVIQMLNLRLGLGLADWVNGSTGVDLFFVISGFVMTISSAPLRTARHPARIFLARRLERIVPLYWIATTAKVLMVLALPVAAIDTTISARRMAESYLFVPSHAGPILFVGWTLTFEMAFYVLFAIALALGAPLLRTLGPLLLLMAFAAQLPHVRVPFILFWLSHTTVLEFFYGVLIAIALPKLRKMPRSLAMLLGAAGLGVLLFVAWPMATFWSGVTWGIPAAAVVMAAVALEERWSARVPRWLLELGDASYSIYLVHGLVLPLFGVVLARLGYRGQSLLPVVIVLLTVLSVGSGEAVYRVIERPIMQWFKGRRRTAVPANG